MSLFLRDQDKIEEGREKKLHSIVTNMLKENMSINTICRVAECDESYVKKVQEEIVVE